MICPSPLPTILGYLATGYAAIYLVAPMMWGYAKRHGLISVSDILAHRFGMRFGAIWLTVHETSFVLWFFATGAHVLAHLDRTRQLVVADLTAADAVPGAVTRRSLVTAALVTVFAALFASADHTFARMLDAVLPTVDAAAGFQAVLRFLLTGLIALGTGYLAADRRRFDQLPPAVPRHSSESSCSPRTCSSRSPPRSVG